MVTLYLLPQIMPKVEAKLRAQLKEDDAKSRQSLDALRSALLTIQSRFTKGLEANTAPNAQKTISHNADITSTTS